jgi:uncharacterized protein YndB with AHSA1/START domain
MPNIERTITTEAPPGRVWAYLSDFTTTKEWDPVTTSTVREQGNGGVGTVYRTVWKMLGQELEIEYTVVEHEAPHLLRLRGSTTSMELLDTIIVEPEGTGSTVIYRAEFSPQGAAELAIPLLPLTLKNLADDTAEGIEERLLYL